MANSGWFNTSVNGSFYFSFEWWLNSINYDARPRSANVHVIVVAHNTSGSYRTVYRKYVQSLGGDRYYDESGQKFYDGNYMCEFNMDVYYNDTGDCYFNGYVDAGVGTSSGANIDGNGEWWLDNIGPAVSVPSVNWLSVTSISATSAYASWSVANWNGNTGSTNTRNHNDAGTQLSSVSGTSATFTGLARNTYYRARATASNSAGSSSPGEVRYKTRKSTPVSRVDLVSNSPNQIVVSRAITDYGCDNDTVLTTDQLSYRKQGDTNWINTSATISGLLSNTTYEIRHNVGVTDNVGALTAYSPILTITTQNPNIVATIAEMTLSSQTVQYTGDYPLDTLKYKISTDNGTTWGADVILQITDVTAVGSGTGTPFPNTGKFTVSGLTSGQSYLFQLEASLLGGIVTTTQVQGVVPGRASISSYTSPVWAESNKELHIIKPFSNGKLVLKLLDISDNILLTRNITHNTAESFSYIINDMTLEELSTIYTAASTAMSVNLIWRLESYDSGDVLIDYVDYSVNFKFQSSVWIDINNTPYDPYNINPVKNWVRGTLWAKPEDVIVPENIKHLLQFP